MRGHVAPPRKLQQGSGGTGWGVGKIGVWGRSPEEILRFFDLI